MATDPERDAALRDLYPTLTEPQLREAQQNLCRYFEIAWDIQRQGSEADKDAQVDTSESSSTMKERSNVFLEKII